MLRLSCWLRVTPAAAERVVEEQLEAFHDAENLKVLRQRKTALQLGCTMLAQEFGDPDASDDETSKEMLAWEAGFRE